MAATMAHPIPEQVHIPGGPPAGIAERRAHPRTRCELAARVTEFDPHRGAHATWRARVVDVGRGGLCLRSRRPVAQGASLIIEVRSGKKRSLRVLFGVVRYARHAESVEHALGVSFRALPRSAEMKRWMAGRTGAA